MNAKEKLTEQHIGQKIESLSNELLGVIDNALGDLTGYTEEEKQRVMSNALFNAIVNGNHPNFKSPTSRSMYLLYAERARVDFQDMIKFLRDFAAESYYK